MSGTIPTGGGGGSGNVDHHNTSSSGVQGGHPIQIIDITKDHKFKLDEDALKSILYHPKAKSKKVNSFRYY